MTAAAADDDDDKLSLLKVTWSPNNLLWVQCLPRMLTRARTKQKRSRATELHTDRCLARSKNPSNSEVVCSIPIKKNLWREAVSSSPN
jgi:hypothetical protein